MRTRPGARVRALPGALAALALSAAPGHGRAATGDFLTPFAGVSSRYDDNLFRLSDDIDPRLVLGESHTADWNRTTFAGINADWRPGLQQFTAALSVSNQTFQRFDFLDNTGFSSSANWNMAAGRRFTGRARASYQRSLGSFEDFRDTQRDILTTRRLDVELDYRVTPDIELRLGAGFNGYQHDLESRQASDQNNLQGWVGVARRSPLDNRLGVEFRRERGRFPNRTFNAFSLVDDGFTQDTASVTATWQGGFTRLDGRLGYTWRRFDHLDDRDISGLSGELGLRHDFSAKLALDLQAYRRLQSLDDLLSNSVIETGVTLRPTWAPSDRLLVSAQSAYRDRQFQDSGLFPGATQPTEQIWSNGLDVSYMPRSFLTLTAGLEQGRRSSNRPGFDYDYKAVSFSLQLTL